MLHKGDGIILTICACYSWEITLASTYQQGVREEGGEVAKAYVTNDENSC
jgi:hypothetical protein